MEECQRRLCSMIHFAKNECDIPEDKPLAIVGLCLSGCDQEKTNKELEKGLLGKYPELSDRYYVGTHLLGVLTAGSIGHGAVVLKCNIGSGALAKNTDGSVFSVGNLGHVLADEGSAYWISLKAIKIVFDEQEQLDSSPNQYSTDYIWTAIKQYFEIKERCEIMPYIYRQFRKDKIAGLYKRIARGGRRNDNLCKWLLNEAGRHMAKLVLALLPKIDKTLKSAEGGLGIICTGMVFKDWDLLRYSFVMEMDNEISVREFTLLKTTASGAQGAAVLGAKRIFHDLNPQRVTHTEAFFHYNRDFPTSTLFARERSQSFRSTSSSDTRSVITGPFDEVMETRVKERPQKQGNQNVQQSSQAKAIASEKVHFQSEEN